jgi:hypothetical protein
LNRLHRTALDIESYCSPFADFEGTIAHEMRNSKAWGGRTVMDD